MWEAGWGYLKLGEPFVLVYLVPGERWRSEYDKKEAKELVSVAGCFAAFVCSEEAFTLLLAPAYPLPSALDGGSTLDGYAQYGIW